MIIQIVFNLKFNLNQIYDNLQIFKDYETIVDATNADYNLSLVQSQTVSSNIYDSIPFHSFWFISRTI